VCVVLYRERDGEVPLAMGQRGREPPCMNISTSDCAMLAMRSGMMRDSRGNSVLWTSQIDISDMNAGGTADTVSFLERP